MVIFMEGNNNLDRHFGAFGFIGVNAAIEGIQAAENYSRNTIIENKNATINSLIGECEELEDNFENLSRLYAKLKENHKKLLECHSKDIDDYNELAAKYNEMSLESNKLIAENKALKGQAKNTVFENELKIDDMLEVNIKEQKETEASFAALYKSINTSKQNCEFSLKVAFTQNKISKEFIEHLIFQGVILREMYEAHFSQKIFTQNELDLKRGAITYDESISWLKVHNSSMYKKMSN